MTAPIGRRTLFAAGCRIQRREGYPEASGRHDGGGHEKCWGLDLVHIIGPKMGHGYDEASKTEINRRIDEAVAKGRDPMPKSLIRFTTTRCIITRIIG